MRKGTPDQFLKELEAKLHELNSTVESSSDILADNRGTPEDFMNALESKLAEFKDVESSAEIIDDGEEVIEADMTVFDEEADDADDIDEEADDADDIDEENISIADYSALSDEYLDELYSNVEARIESIVDEVSWDRDEDSISLDAGFADGRVINFNIPLEDLTGDLDADTTYVYEAVAEE